MIFHCRSVSARELLGRVVDARTSPASLLLVHIFAKRIAADSDLLFFLHAPT